MNRWQSWTKTGIDAGSTNQGPYEFKHLELGEICGNRVRQGSDNSYSGEKAS
jgi:hypothetical protein